MNMRMRLNAWIYFYHLDKFCVLPDYPETVQDSMKSDFTETNALARTAPVFSYQHSGPRTITINFKLHRDMMRDLNRGVSNLKDNVVDFSSEDYIDTLIRYLQAIALPKYNAYSANSKAVVPPMVAIRFGNNIFIKGVVSSGITVTYSKPILIDDKYAIADINFTVSEVDPYDAEKVVEMGSFRGITKSFKDGIFKETEASVSVNQSNVTNSRTNNLLTGVIKVPGTSVAMGKKKASYTATTHTSSSGDTHGGHGGSLPTSSANSSSGGKGGKF